MGQVTGISWTDHTFNLVWGCTKVSSGCANCYAEKLANRYRGVDDMWGPNGTRRVLGDTYWKQPAKWRLHAEIANERRKVFCSSMCDIFEPHPIVGQQLAKLWPIIRETSPWLIWQLLTKRPEEIALKLPSDWEHGYPNVWLGVSIEDNAQVHRADALREIPAAFRFVSYEPALGDLDALDLSGLSWVIFGGESGPGFRACDLQWARNMRDRCKSSGVAFYFKQTSAFRTGTDPQLDGETLHEFPNTLLYGEAPVYCPDVLY